VGTECCLTINGSCLLAVVFLMLNKKKKSFAVWNDFSALLHCRFQCNCCQAPMFIWCGVCAWRVRIVTTELYHRTICLKCRGVKSIQTKPLYTFKRLHSNNHGCTKCDSKLHALHLTPSFDRTIYNSKRVKLRQSHQLQQIWHEYTMPVEPFPPLRPFL
jgi:hypothetical protein